MECNKEEAIRAKVIAEKKMQNKDFFGARKIALKAQQLYPELENISQMIVVCDVHCSAEKKVYGNENDWYGILQIDPTADDASIKKQYRKFALLLHPDKNKFSGATDAFKLIGEAQRVLLDRQKRELHDRKCKGSRPMAPNWAPQKASSNTNVGKQPWVQNHFMNKPSSPFTSFNPQHQQPQRQAQPVFPTERKTFWTACPYCSVRYQFYREVVNRLLHCQSCEKSFTAYEMKAQATPQGANWSQPACPQQKEVPHQGAVKANMRGTSGKVDVKIHNEGGAASRKVNGTKRKQKEELSEDSCSESSSASEEDVDIEENGDDLAKQNFGCYREHPRRSTRSKQHISYDENLSDDDDFGSPSKRAKSSGSVRATEDTVLKQEAREVNKPDSACMEDDANKLKRKESAFYEGSFQNGEENTEKENGEIGARKDRDQGSSIPNGGSSDPGIFEYPDPDFNDFDSDRKEKCFSVGQIWAVYDTVDAMPRFYARINKVRPGFKLNITWLEPDPDDENEMKWVGEGLPVSCGKFKHGQSENTKDNGMFSHFIYWVKSSEDTYKIYPRKGETWALFKNWDIKWRSDPERPRKYEYEFVEILSDYAEGIGVFVAYMGKVKGFSCLFCRTKKEGFDFFPIPPEQLFKFSHRVPSFQMTGKERKDVPKGSFELDPASLPTNLEEIAVPEDSEVEAAKTHPDISFSESTTGKVEPTATSKGNTSVCQVNRKTDLTTEYISSDNCSEDLDDSLPSTPPEIFEIPDPLFYDFDGDKSPEKFQIGQIWALYSEEDGLPKYYARIMKIDIQPEFKLYIGWLAPCPPPKDAVKWLDKKMLTGCGIFRHEKSRQEEYIVTGPFSHRVRVEHTDKNFYAIFPRKGEVWALYKNWSAGITLSGLKTCEYDMVEILEENDSQIKVLVLELVIGLKSVFRAQSKSGSAVTMKISRVELLRFSHQIPAFRLTSERGGTLEGYWELDPAALPITFFHSS
ncbi:uncharacterized protein LOC130775115 [Actinidia eriantha]|uniref:uncharacterized protein LOC130775115 n=1 Tax=Actinidia eriantha TaxID=165200 RepID=UPI00258AF3D0|nr:uncharacterized protein LOC130775115 [Actinidia eriantha]XP_057489209.1 uncharacterized protein LOC130775115 [Actinidia eriantha]XP_057489210.1 uncharacterized protein LOC130775115 [Actinidia eriantha]